MRNAQFRRILQGIKSSILNFNIFKFPNVNIDVLCSYSITINTWVFYYYFAEVGGGQYIAMRTPVRGPMSVCLSACISQRPHVQTSPNFLYVLTVAVDRSLFDDNGIMGISYFCFLFLPCDFYLSIFFYFPRLISAVGDWMSTILPHMVWP